VNDYSSAATARHTVLTHLFAGGARLGVHGCCKGQPRTDPNRYHQDGGRS
jgi:hypothetical protein